MIADVKMDMEIKSVETIKKEESFFFGKQLKRCLCLCVPLLSSLHNIIGTS
jgi:hypothetical protein